MKTVRIDISSFLVVVLGILFLAGCKPSVPSKYIQPNEMEDILYDFYITKAMANNGRDFNYDRSLYYQATLKKHGVSEAEFDSSLVYYYTHAERLSKIYQGLSNRLENEAKQLGASVGVIGEYANLTANGDTANIWNDAPTALLMPVAPYNRMDFTLKTDTTYHRGDSFMLNFVSNFMYQSGTKDAVVYVAVTYKNDSVAVSQTHVSSSGVNSLRIMGDKENDVKEIRGFIYLSRGYDDSNTQKLMFISNLQFIRFRQPKTSTTPEGGLKNDSSSNTNTRNTGGVSPHLKPVMKVEKMETMTRR